MGLLSPWGSTLWGPCGDGSSHPLLTSPPTGETQAEGGGGVGGGGRTCDNHFPGSLFFLLV